MRSFLKSQHLKVNDHSLKINDLFFLKVFYENSIFQPKKINYTIIKPRSKRSLGRKLYDPIKIQTETVRVLDTRPKMYHHPTHTV